jgi:hypothetical protein
MKPTKTPCEQSADLLIIKAGDTLHTNGLLNIE